MLVSICWSGLWGVEPALMWCSVSGGSGLRRYVGPSDLDEGGERRSIVDGQLGQHATVDLDLRSLQALDEAVVGHAVGASAGVDPLDPQATEVTLTCATVAVGVSERVGDLLLGLAVQARTLSAIAAGALENNPALLVGVYRPFHACHVRLLALIFLLTRTETYRLPQSAELSLSLSVELCECHCQRS